jgi:hypothetical protein
LGAKYGTNRVKAHWRIGLVRQIMNAAPSCAGFYGFCFENDFLFWKFLGLTFFLNAGKLFNVLRCL